MGSRQRKRGHDKIKVLHIVSDMRLGGIETFVMNILRHMDMERCEPSILMARDVPGNYDSEIEQMGIRTFRLHRTSLHDIATYKAQIRKVFLENEFDAVHCHMNAWAGLFLPIAKSFGVPIRIAHSHTSGQSLRESGFTKILFKTYLRGKIKTSATHYVACSEAAGRWLFGPEIAATTMRVVWNGIDTRRFEFDPDVRREVRGALGIEEESLVVGHVGNMRHAKNQIFLLNVFSEIHKAWPDAKLVMAGDGARRGEIERTVREGYLDDSVWLLGRRNDIVRLLNAFDVFIMTSLYEGFPVVLIEAQASGLPCVVSDRITDEVNISDNTRFLSLKESTGVWRDAVLEKGSTNRDRRLWAQVVRTAGFDIQTSVDRLCRIYRGDDSDDWR